MRVPPKCSAWLYSLFLINGIFSSIFTAIAEPPSTSIGVILPLSGPIAEYGVAIRNGIQMAQDEIAPDSQRCRFIIEDSQYNSTLALAAFNKLVGSEKTKLVYAFGGPMGEALAPLAEQRQIPFISDTPDPAVGAGRSFVIRYAHHRRDIGKAINSLLATRGVTSVAVAIADNQYLRQVLLGSQELATNVKFSEAITLSPGDQDMRTAALKLGNSDADALALFVLPGQLSSLARALQPYQEKRRRLLLVSDFADSPQEIIAAAGSLTDAVFPNQAASKDFKKRYVSAFQSSAQLTFAAEGYDVAKLLETHLCGKSDLTGKSVMAILEQQVQSFVGALGETTLVQADDGDTYFRAPTKIFVVRGNEAVVLE